MLLLPQPRMANLPVSFPVQTFSAWLPEPEGVSRERISARALMHDRPRILSIGDDPILLYSRRLVLERDGYLVASLRSDAVIEDAQLRGFDLVMLCHSVPDNVANRILEVLWRLTPQTPVLLVSGPDRPFGSGPHQITVPAHPVALLDAVAQQIAIHRNPGIRES